MSETNKKYVSVCSHDVTIIEEKHHFWCSKCGATVMLSDERISKDERPDVRGWLYVEQQNQKALRMLQKLNEYINFSRRLTKTDLRRLSDNLLKPLSNAQNNGTYID